MYSRTIHEAANTARFRGHMMEAQIELCGLVRETHPTRTYSKCDGGDDRGGTGRHASIRQGHPFCTELEKASRKKQHLS